MARLATSTPKYRRHKATAAITTLANGTRKRAESNTIGSLDNGWRPVDALLHRMAMSRLPLSS